MDEFQGKLATMKAVRLNNSQIASFGELRNKICKKVGFLPKDSEIMRLIIKEGMIVLNKKFR